MSRANLLPWREPRPAWLRRLRYQPTPREIEDHAHRMGRCDGARGEWGRYLPAQPTEAQRWAYYWGWKETRE